MSRTTTNTRTATTARTVKPMRRLRSVGPHPRSSDGLYWVEAATLLARHGEKRAARDACKAAIHALGKELGYTVEQRGDVPEGLRALVR